MHFNCQRGYPSTPPSSPPRIHTHSPGNSNINTDSTRTVSDPCQQPDSCGRVDALYGSSTTTKETWRPPRFVLVPTRGS
jgi:hypothetical protein